MRTERTHPRCTELKCSVLGTKAWRAQPLKVQAEEEVRTKEGGGNYKEYQGSLGVLKKGVPMLSIFWQRFNQIKTERQITVTLKKGRGNRRN